jgi:hypothetical protein
MASKSPSRKPLFVLVALLCSIGTISLAPTATADSVTYTYTGEVYTNCFGSYAPSSGPCTEQQTITFTLAAPLAPDQTQDNISALVTSFSFSDGTGLVITQADDPLFGFAVNTDTSGNIVEWNAGAIEGNSGISSSNGINLVGPISGSSDFSYANDSDSAALGTCVLDISPANCSDLNVGYELNDPGSWSVPEPSTLALLGIGLIGLIVLRPRRRINRLANQSA